MLFPYLISGTKCKDKVEEGAEGLILEVGLEDEVDGVTASEVVVLGLVGNTSCHVPDSLVHVGSEFHH